MTVGEQEKTQRLLGFRVREESPCRRLITFLMPDPTFLTECLTPRFYLTFSLSRRVLDSGWAKENPAFTGFSSSEGESLPEAKVLAGG